MAVSALLVGLAGPSPASARADLVSSDPAANAMLVDAPPDVSLTFSEAVDPSASRVDLHDPSHIAVAGIGPVQAGIDGRTLRVALPSIGPGLYTVTYQVVSAVDGQLTMGDFTFNVDPSTQSPTSSAASVDAWTVIARWTALAAALVATGTLVAWQVSLRTVLRSLPDPARRTPWRLVAGSSVTAFAALALYLALAARGLVDAGAHHEHGVMLDFAAPFGWTPFAVAMRVALAGTFAAFAFSIGRAFHAQEVARRGAGPDPRTDRRLGVVVLALLAAALGGVSMASSAGALGGPAFGLLEWAHLLAAAAWLGALPALGLTALRARSTGLAPRPVLASALRAHVPVTLVAAPALALTGLASSPVVLGSAREAIASPYGNLLVAKALLFAVALAIGVANHLLARARRPRTTVPLLLGEIAVAAVAVMVAATLVSTQPAASRAPAPGAPARPVQLVGEAGPYRVQVAVSAATPGHQRYAVLLSDLATDAPATDVTGIGLTFEPPAGSGLHPEGVEPAPQPVAGRWAAEGDFASITGTWRLAVTIQRTAAPDEGISFELPVDEPGQGELAPPPDTGVGVPAPLGAMWALLPPGPLAGWLPAVFLAVVAGLLWVAALRRRRAAQSASSLLDVARVVVLLLALVAGLTAGSRLLVQAADAVPADAASATSPTAASDDSIARGERLYHANCAACHGADGRGDGPTAGELPWRPRDLRQVVPQLAEGELAHRIAAGLAGTEMPAFSGSLSEAERWDLVNLLRDRFGD